MSGIDVGTAFVRVLPDTRDFRALLQKQVDAAVAQVKVPALSATVNTAGGSVGAGTAAASTAAAANLGKVEKSAQGAAKGLLSANNQSNILRGSLIGLSRITPVAVFGLGAYGTAAIAAGLAIKGAISSAADFESQLNSFQAVTGVSANELDRVRRQAIALGADTTLAAVSAGDAAVALTELAKAGLSVNDALGASRGVLQLAGAASISAGAAAQIVATQLNAFKLAGTDAVRVADLIASASIAAQGEITDFAAAFQQVSAVAHQVDLPIEQTTALLTELAKAGLQGADAGTSLRTTLLRFIPTTKEARSFVAALGIEFEKSQTLGEQLPRVIEQYRNALSALNPIQRTTVLNQIFGQDAIRAASIIFDQETGALERNTRALSDQGVAARLNAAKAEGLKGAFAGLQSNIETVGIELGELVDGPLEGFVRGISDSITDIESFVKALGSIGDVQLPDAIEIPLRFVDKTVDDSIPGQSKSLGEQIKDTLKTDLDIVQQTNIFSAFTDQPVIPPVELNLGKKNDQFGFDAFITNFEDTRQQVFDATFGAAARRNPSFRKKVQDAVKALIAGSAPGGQTPGEAVVAVTETQKFQGPLLEAQLKGNLDGELAAARAIEKFLNDSLDLVKKGSAAYLTILKALKAAHDQTEAIVGQIAQVLSDSFAPQAARVSLQQAVAEGTKSLTDDIAADQALIDLAEQKLAALKKAGASEVDITNQEIAVQQARNKKKADQEKVVQAQQDEAVTARSNTEAQLRLEASRANNQGAAEKKLVAFLRKEASDASLTTAERLRFAAALDSELKTQASAIVQAQQSEVDFRKSVVELAIARAENTPGIGDDIAAQNALLREDDRQIAFWKTQKDKNGKITQEALATINGLLADKERIRGKIKSLKGQGQGGFTLQEFFQEAADEFNQFGSNVTSSIAGGGILSGQDARGAVGGIALNNKNAIPAAQLTEAQKQTQLLTQIATAVTGPINASQVKTVNGPGGPVPIGIANARRNAAYIQGS